MIRKQLHFVTTAALLISLSSLAATPLENATDYAKTLRTLKIDKEIQKNLKTLMERNKVYETRPAFCPLNNTHSYKQTVDSLRSIVTVFKDDCFDGNQALVEQILASTNTLEDELNKLSEEQGKEVKDVVPTADDIKVSGIPIATLMNGMNTLFTNNKCTNLEKTPFLERSADIIQTFAQFGLYSPSGVTVAYGGLAVSSILRFINGIFSKRFEFENEADIETFVKLNCAYYDVRNQVRTLEMFDVDTLDHLKDKDQSGEILKNVKNTTKKFFDAKEKVFVEIEKIKVKNTQDIDKNLEDLIKPLFEKMKTPLIDLPGKSAKYQQAEVLSELFEIQALLNSKLEDFFKNSQGSDKFLNLLFKNKLKQIDQADELMELSPKDFSSSFMLDLASSFNRVLNNIAKKREDYANNFEKNFILEVDGTELSIKDLKDFIDGKEFDKIAKDYKTTLDKAEALYNRLELITAKKEFTTEDSKDGGVREIIKSLDIVKNHVYGKYGKQFIEKMRDLSESQNKNFDEKYSSFKENYSTNLNQDEILNACVDATTGREIWVYAQKLSELGYDFLATNNDVFGDPDKNSDRKKIKSHNDSAILAKRIIDAKIQLENITIAAQMNKESIEIAGEEVAIDTATEIAQKIKFYNHVFTIEQAQDYLKKEFGQKGLKDDRIGHIMLKVMNNKSKIIKLQNFYKDNKCDTISTLGN